MASTNEGPRALRAGAGALVALESIALLVVAGIYAVRAAQGLGDGAGALAAMCGLAGAGLGAAAVALLRGRRWPRGLAVTWQLLQIAAGALVLGWSVGVGAVVIAVALAAGACLIFDARRENSA